MPPIPPEILGPTGLVIAALLAIGVLWRSHERADQDVREDRDYWRQLALTGLQVAEKAADVAIRKR